MADTSGVIFDILKPKTTRDARGNSKQRLDRIAVGFPTKDGMGLRFQLADGVSISGEVVIMQRESRADEDAAEHDDSIPL